MKPGVWFLAWPGCRLLAGVNFLQFEFTILADFFQQNIFTQMFKSASEEPEIGTRGREQNLFAQASSLSLSLTHRLSFSWSCFCSLSQVPHSLEGTLICWRQSKLLSVHTQHTHAHTCTHAFVFPSLQRTLHQLTLKTYWNVNHSCNLPNPPWL